MTALLWIVDHPFIAAGVLCAVAAALTAVLCAFVHFVLGPAAQWLMRLVRDVREPSGKHRRIGNVAPLRASDDTAELRIPHDLVEETAA